MNLHYLPFHIDDLLEVIVLALVLDLGTWLWLHYHHAKRKVVALKERYTPSEKARILRTYIPETVRSQYGLDEEEVGDE